MRVVAFFFALLTALLPAAAAQNTIGEADVFREVLKIVEAQYVDEPNPQALVKAAVDGLIKAHPSERVAALAKQRLADIGATIDHQVAVFNDVFAAVKQDDGGKTDVTSLFASALTPMLASLDAHSNYLTPQALKETQAASASQFGGLGIEVTMTNGELAVVSPLDDTPAAKAGILAGDHVTAIDGVPTAGATLNDLVAKLRGPVGAPVTLTVARQGVDAPLTIRLVRATVMVPAVRQRVEGDIGYIRVSAFNAPVSEQVAAAFAALEANGGADRIKGYVLDLRNNPGGLLDQAVALADDFIDAGEIAMMRGRVADNDQRYSAKLGDLANHKAMVVLVNQGTASGSEIVAGALQDHHRAALIGVRTNGKGTIQTIIPLAGWGALRLTTSRFYTPAGHNLDGVGLNPDVLVEGGDSTADQLPADDRQLQAALAYLHGTLGSAPLGKRVALVIGNSEYQHTPTLPNPKNDASDIAAALQRLGFIVTLAQDLTKPAMDRTLAQFARDARSTDAALFYYAGHAMQFQGVNYLAKGLALDIRFAAR